MKLGPALRAAGIESLKRQLKGLSLFRNVPIGAVFVTGIVRTHAPQYTKLEYELHNVGPVNVVDMLWERGSLLVKTHPQRARHLQWRDTYGQWRPYSHDNRYRDCVPGPNAVCAWALPARLPEAVYERPVYNKAVAEMLRQGRSTGIVFLPENK